MSDPLPENPFSTRHIQPGAVSYFFAEGQDADEACAELLRRLLEERRGAIVGPHGSGKTTLCELAAARAPATWTVQWIRLRNGQPPAAGWLNTSTWTAETLVIVDGYEQLNWWSRLRLSWALKRTRAMLLATAHRPIRQIAVLRETSPDMETALHVVDRLLQGDWSIITKDDVRACLERCGDLRETLFALYDVFERRTRSGASHQVKQDEQGDSAE